MGFVNDHSDPNDHKTIDRERNIVFKIHRTSALRGRDSFELNWHKQIIKINAGIESEKLVIPSEGASSAKFDYVWIVTAIAIPAGFPEPLSVVCDVIQEAFTAYGLFYRTDRVHRLEVKFVEGVEEKPINWGRI